MRKSRYRQEIQNLEAQIPEYRHRQQEDPHISELLNNIERTELERIYGGRIFSTLH
jgi:hypothetical protein